MTLDLQAADRRRAMRPRADLALLATAELVTQFGAMLTVLAIALHLQPSGPGWVAAAMVADSILRAGELSKHTAEIVTSKL